MGRRVKVRLDSCVGGVHSMHWSFYRFILMQFLGFYEQDLEHGCKKNSGIHYSHSPL